jgi:hypothetical protein
MFVQKISAQIAQAVFPQLFKEGKPFILVVLNSTKEEDEYSYKIHFSGTPFEGEEGAPDLDALQTMLEAAAVHVQDEGELD